VEVLDKGLYRNLIQCQDLIKTVISIEETDLLILAERDLEALGRRWTLDVRSQIKSYIKDNPDFLESLVPVEAVEGAPKVVKKMCEAAERVGVGPMASVAGAIAEEIGQMALSFVEEVIVENGGDIFIRSKRERYSVVWAGDSPLSLRLGFKIPPSETPLGICTSSGKYGPSLNFGQADAVCVVSHSTPLADAVATFLGNLVKDTRDISKGLEKAKEIDGVLGTIIIVDDKVGIWGRLDVFSR
jgi:hypothetical protein